MSYPYHPLNIKLEKRIDKMTVIMM